MSAFSLQTERWTAQVQRWPSAGRHILAQYDARSVVVYQAYRPEIAAWAVEHQAFGGPWSLDRMTWVKPNFLWMMYRCGWARKQDQERVLAVRIDRAAFEHLLAIAMKSKAPKGVTTEQWRRELRTSDVRLQWDPDHGPSGEKQPRRAIQLGLRGKAAQAYASEWLLSIEDITPFVHEQYEAMQAGGREALRTPLERVYLPESEAVRERLLLGR